MANKQLRIILDTNLWISFLITKNFSKLDTLLISGKSKLIFSEELLNEFILVATRSKLKKYFSRTDLLAILEVLDSEGELVKVISKINLCRDIKDNFLLSLAVDGKADYLLTGDKDLLILKKIKNTKIISLSEFLAKT